MSKKRNRKTFNRAVRTASKTPVFKPTVLASAVAAALCAGPSVALAQTDDGTVLEEIVVTGVKRSIIDSIAAKRFADGVVDAISAEDVGKFPDKNLAEALQRVPGVVINREYGEGERVNIRGTAPNLTRTLLNGHALATADWFILDQLNTTRSFNYLMLPSDIIGQVKVYKSSQANLEEGGIGGTVDVITRKPFDMDSFAAAANLQFAHTELADETDPNVSGLISWTNDQRTFGIMAAAVRQERNIRRDGVEVLGYFTADADPGPGTQDVLVPSLIGSALFEQERVRTGGNFSMQYRPNDRVEFNLTGLYSEFQADNINQNFLTWGIRAIGNGGTLTNATIVDGTAVAGTIESLNGGTADFGVVYDAIQREAVATTSNIDLVTDITLNELWSASVRIGYTEAEGNTENQPFVEFGSPASFNYDLRGATPQVSFNNVDPDEPNDLQFIFSSLHEILNDDSEGYLYADAERQLDGDVFDSIEFGVKATDHERELVFNATTYGGFHVPINTTAASAFAGPLTPGDFLSGISGAGTLDSYWQINRGATSELLFDNLANTSRILYPQQSFSVQEDTLGGYVMANIDSGPWRGNVGVRVVRTEQTSSGNVSSPQGQVQNAFGAYDPVTVERSYTDVLPSLNLVYEATDKLLYRFSASRVMTRPDFTDITPRASLNPGALTGVSGNPDLDPFLANQFDVTVEWYPSEQSVLAAALFYKDIESFITDNPVDRVLTIQANSAPNASCTAAGANLFDCPFVINERSNGGGGESIGLELAGVWTFDNGFGVQGNYTYVDAEADSGDPLPGASENQFNLSGFYEIDKFSARLSYTYRSEFFVTFDRSTQLDQDALESLDASLQYFINDKIALTFDAVNLTEETIEQFAGNNNRPRAIYDNGRIYFAGVRIRY
ncbi:MAG: TonB-dependent receptor [Pseudomonadota bacterium]